MTQALIFVAVMLLIGVILRQRIALFRSLYIPASVIAGFVGLLFVQVFSGFHETAIGSWTGSTTETLKSWPGWLIAVVFAGMLIDRKASPAKESAKRVGQQGLMVWIIVLGQTAVGLMATFLIVQMFFDVPNSFGMLIETGFAGGHGTAGAMGEVYAHPTIDLPSGRDLGMLMATCGLVYGVVTGIFWINVGVRRGWISKSALKNDSGNQSEAKEKDFGPIGIGRAS